MEHASSLSSSRRKSHRVHHIPLIVILSVFVLFGGGVIVYAGGFVGKVFPITASLVADAAQPLSAPVTVQFSVPVAVQDAQTAIRLSPKTAFHLQSKDPASVSGYASAFEMVPDGRFVPATDYTVSIGTLMSLSGSTLKASSYRFTTVGFPSVVSVQPADGNDVEIDQPIALTFRGLTDDFDVRVTLDPPADLVEMRDGDRLVFKPQTPLVQGQTYEVRIRTSVKGAVLEAQDTRASFSTRGPITLASVSPKDGDPRAPQVGPITLTFDRPVQQEGIENFVHIAPEIQGIYAWKDAQTLVFQPKEYMPEGISYTVTVDPGLKAFEGSSHAADDLKFGFKTRYANGRMVSPPVRAVLVKEGRSVEVDLTQQALYAYENGKLMNAFLISSGLPEFASPEGAFKVTRKKTVTRYTWTYGPNDPRNYDLAGVKWNMNLSNTLYWLHGAYWHNNFGRKMSHGCINIHNLDAEWLYGFTEVGTPVQMYKS